MATAEELLAENELLKAKVSRLEGDIVGIKEIFANDKGQFHTDFEGLAAKMLGHLVTGIFYDQSGRPRNYKEMVLTLTVPEDKNVVPEDEYAGSFVVTIVKKFGKSPGELHNEALRELEKAKAELRVLKEKHGENL